MFINSPPCHINKLLNNSPTQKPIHIGHFNNFPNFGLNLVAFSRIGLNIYEILIIKVAPKQDKIKNNSSIIKKKTSTLYNI
jgi:hypothetical protein